MIARFFSILLNLIYWHMYQEKKTGAKSPQKPPQKPSRHPRSTAIASAKSGTSKPITSDSVFLKLCGQSRREASQFFESEKEAGKEQRGHNDERRVVRRLQLVVDSQACIDQDPRNERHAPQDNNQT